MEKSTAGATVAPPPDDISFERMLSISQFSRSTGISRSALIFYDENGVFHPAFRDPKNNYRYYRPEQIITANIINVLAELNIPLKHIKRLSNKRSATDMIKLFGEHRETLQAHIAQLQRSMKLIDVFRSLLHMGANADESAVVVKTLPRWKIVIGPETDFPAGTSFYRPYLAFCAWAEEQGYPTHFPAGGYFPNFASFCDHPGRPTNFFLLLDTNDESPDTLDFLTAYTRGFYGQLGDVAERMAQALDTQGLAPDGPVLNTYIEDEISTMDPSQYLMQATMPIRHLPARSVKESKDG
ncbi:MAG: helix-turn-helix domain-containing protein [Actinomycetia bacterium]|nr:helix-turn-helix domain-containing protein [Actinomycetes bacterium]